MSTSDVGFDVGRLERQPLAYRLAMRFTNYPYLQWLLDAARWWTPAVRVPGLATFVLRHDDVRQVLGDSEAFHVPWGRKMELVTSDTVKGVDDGRNFVLGMKEADEVYRRDYRMLATAFPYAEALTTVSELAAKASSQILDGVGDVAELDAVERLVTAVPAQMCSSYYGLEIEDHEHFAKCTLAVSSFLFGTGFDPPRDRAGDKAMAMALDAAPEIRRVIRRSIEARRPPICEPMSPLDRLLGPRRCDDTWDSVHVDHVRAQMFGMVMGFIPTNVLAGGNILETLMRQPHFKAKVIEAVDVGDDDLLWRCLRETLRFRNINFGPLRRCARDHHLRAEGGRFKIRAGEKVLASTQSAMFDPRRIRHPHVFDSGRPDQDYLSFGVGQHWCLGAYIAQAQLTQMFKRLFKRFDVTPLPGRAGRMRRFHVFPLHMNVALHKRSKP